MAMAEAGKKRKRSHKIFNESNVLTLPIRRSQYTVWDRGRGRGAGACAIGLGILVSPGGVRSYRSTFYFPGSPRAHSRHLGRVGEMTLGEAREQCRLDRRLAREGKDPRADDPTTSDTYEAAVKDYVDREQIGHLRRVKAKEAYRTLLNDCEDWKVRPLATIRGTEIQHLLDRVRDGDERRGLKPRPYLANLLHARLNSFFTWCVKPGIGKIKVSPMVGIDKPFTGAKPRELPWFKGAAADQVIKQLWSAADKLGSVEGRYLKVLLLTGKRKTALAGMKWEEIDDTWFWNAPEGHTNKRLHGVPLSSFVQRILHPHQTSGFVFPGKRGGRIDVSDALTDEIIKSGANADFILHGCRHIAETKLAELKIPIHIRDRLFDHAEHRGAGKGYDHHEYEDEMRAAVEQWAAHIERLVTEPSTKRLRG
jgi:integrase